jgi:hypothetical protein
VIDYDVGYVDIRKGVMNIIEIFENVLCVAVSCFALLCRRQGKKWIRDDSRTHVEPQISARRFAVIPSNRIILAHFTACPLQYHNITTQKLKVSGQKTSSC